MPALAYLGKKGLNLTSDWQAYAIIGTFIIGIVVVIVGIIKIRKWQPNGQRKDDSMESEIGKLIALVSLILLCFYVGYLVGRGKKY